MNSLFMNSLMVPFIIAQRDESGVLQRVGLPSHSDGAAPRLVVGETVHVSSLERCAIE